MAKGKLSIHSDNILPIIKKWLYSDKDIFLRELVSNACDAISKFKLIEPSKDTAFQIHIDIDKNQKTLSISDNGLGMTKEEVKKYIAQIAFSGAKEFLEKYQSSNPQDQMIGHFGLGFYSAYMVAKKVEIKTKSYQKEQEGVFWDCDGSSQYTIKTIPLKKRQTTIILYIDQENEEFLEQKTIETLLQKYCPYLPFPIYVNQTLFKKREPLWLQSPSACDKKDYLAFYRELYPMDPDPIFWIHLNIDYPFHLKGILYFPKMNQLDTRKSDIKLFCNRVFVSDDCKDLLPEYLMVLKGAIDSPDIPLNVSRSYLQSDHTVKKVSSHISKKICDRLSQLYHTQKETFFSYWPEIETIIKLGILQDEKFYDRAKNFLVWKNIENHWTTIEEYLQRHQENYKNKVFYSHEKETHFLNLYQQKKIEVLLTNAYLDTAILNFLEHKLPSLKFQRIDGAIDEMILDRSKEKTLLDTDGKSKATKIEELVRSSLPKEIVIEVKSLATDSLPGFIMLQEEERRFRDYMQLTNQKVSHSPKQTFVVNTNNPLIQKAFQLREKKEGLAKDLILQVYHLALLSQKELKTSQISDFILHSNQVLEKLTDLSL